MLDCLCVQLGGFANMQLHGYLVCREAGMRLGDAVVGHMAWWYAATRHLTVGCCFHTRAIGY